MYIDEPQTLIVEAQGAGEITAGDIVTGPDVEIINKDLHIATLDENANLYLEMKMVKGRGYVPADQNKRDDMSIGEIAVDSIFTPVKRVNYHVSDTRLGQDGKYDKLTLEIWTDGTIKPDESASLGAKIMNEHLNLFIEMTEHVSNVEIMVEKEKKAKRRFWR